MFNISLNSTRMFSYFRQLFLSLLSLCQQKFEHNTNAFSQTKLYQHNTNAFSLLKVVSLQQHCFLSVNRCFNTTSWFWCFLSQQCFLSVNSCFSKYYNNSFYLSTIFTTQQQCFLFVNSGFSITSMLPRRQQLLQHNSNAFSL
jgi:hypothetical protein